MASLPAGPEITKSWVQLLAKLPGLGPRSARRAALVLLKEARGAVEPLGQAMREAAARDPRLRDLRQSRHDESVRGVP